MTKFVGTRTHPHPYIYIYIWMDDVLSVTVNKVQCGNCDAVSTFTAVTVRIAAKGVLQFPSLHLFSLNNSVPAIRRINKESVANNTMGQCNGSFHSIYILKSHIYTSQHTQHTRDMQMS